MTQYNNNNSRLNELKSSIKTGTEVTLNFSSNTVGDSNHENSFSHKLLLTNTIYAFANNSSANAKLSKTQLHKIG